MTRSGVGITAVLACLLAGCTVGPKYKVPRCPAHSGVQGGRWLEGSAPERSGSARTLVGDLRRPPTERARRTGTWRQPKSEGTGGPFSRGARSHTIQPRFGIPHDFYSSIDYVDSRFGESSLSASRGRPCDGRFRLAVRCFLR